VGQLDGKVVLLTGAARGMGASHARRLVAEGAKVVMGDVLEGEGKALAEELGEAARFVRHDVGSEEDWDGAIAAARGFGRLDGLVNNAGVLQNARLKDETHEAFERLLRINLHGTWWGLRKALPLLREAGGGSIVNVSSQAAMKSYPGLSSYSTSKWAVRGLTKVAAQEFGPDGIRVNSIHPGGIEETGMFGSSGASEEIIAQRKALIPLRRFGSKKDVSDVVVFLLSDASSYLSGVELPIDGGSIV
jgi:3alpha(or 20beta)-hydroxysteroid dehydrogenase